MIKLKHIFLLLFAIFLLWYFTSCCDCNGFSVGIQNNGQDCSNFDKEECGGNCEWNPITNDCEEHSTECNTSSLKSCIESKGKSCSNLDLSWCDMSNTMRNLELYPESNFENTDLSNTISWSHMHIKDLSDSNFKNSKLERVIFPDTDMNLSNTNFINATLINSEFKNSNFTNASLTNVDFTISDISGADFTGSDISGADFTDANISGAIFNSVKCGKSNKNLTGLQGYKCVNGNVVKKITDDNIHHAVDLWMTDNASAIKTYGKINTWDTINVTDMSKLFYGKTDFIDDISSWKVDNVKNMSSMFSDAKAFDQPLNDWNTIKVENMGGMFYEAKAFNHPLNNWKIGQYCTDMDSMFAGAETFDQDISEWHVSSVLYMGSMFSGAEAFNQDISGWDVSKVIDMNNMFLNASKFNQNLNCWKVNPSGIVKIEKMFTGTVIGNSKNDPISTLCWQYTMLEKGDCKECSKYICDGNSGDCFNSPYGPFSSLKQCVGRCLNKKDFNNKYCNNDTAYQSCKSLERLIVGECNEDKLTDRNNNDIIGYTSNNYCISNKMRTGNNDYNCIPKCNPDINGCNKKSYHDFFGSGCTNDNILNNEKACNNGYNHDETSDDDTLCKWNEGHHLPGQKGPDSACESTTNTCG
jgi:surface protein